MITDELDLPVTEMLVNIKLSALSFNAITITWGDKGFAQKNKGQKMHHDATFS